MSTWSESFWQIWSRPYKRISFSRSRPTSMAKFNSFET